MGKETGGSHGASECPGDAGQRRVKLLEGESTYNNWRRKALSGTQWHSVALRETTRLIEVLLSSLAKRHSKIWK